jgi:hypothetical protein
LDIDERLIDHHRGAGVAGDPQHIAPLGLTDQRPGRVVIIGHQIGQPGRALAQGGLHLGGQPAAGRGDRHRHDPRAGTAQRVQRPGVGRQFGEHPIARADQQAQQ